MASLPMFGRRAVAAALIVFALTFSAPALAASPPVVTMLGDSITSGFGLPVTQALPAQLQIALLRLNSPARVLNAGVTGDTTAGGLARVDFSVPPETQVCVVALGANDLMEGVPTARIEANLDGIVRKLKARRITVVLAGGRSPFAPRSAYARGFDAVFRRVAESNRVTLAPDLLAGVETNPRLKQPDGLHPNAAGVKMIAARLAPVVASALRQARGAQVAAPARAGARAGR